MENNPQNDLQPDGKPQMTLLSLFSGAGGFDLAAERLGIKSVMMSDVEPFPIAVTRKRFPNALQLGDINKINGAAIPPVDIVSAGVCCQDVSVAGKRGGLHAARTGLFFQLIRIVDEMMKATDGKFTRYMVIEEVPGLLSSNKGADWKEFIGELSGLGFICDPNIIDAQAHGVAQRRKRIFIACINRRYYNPTDFTDAPKARDKRMERAVKEWGGETFYGIASRPHEPRRKLLSEILERDVDARYYLSVAACLGILRRVDARGKVIPKLLRDALETQAGLFNSKSEVPNSDTEPMSFAPGATCRLPNGKYWSGIAPALLADCGDNATNVAIPIDERNATRNGGTQGVGVGENGDAAYTVTAEYTGAVLSINNHPNDNRIGINEDGLADCLTRRCGSGGGNVPLAALPAELAANAPNVIKGQTVTDETPIILNERAFAAPVDVNIAPTLDASQFKGPACVFEPQSKVYGICSQASNAMQSSNPASGVYEAETSKTLDTTSPNPNKNGGGMVVLAALEGNGARPSHLGTGISTDGVSFTLNVTEKHAVCYQDVVGTLDGGLVKQNNNQTTASGRLIVEEEKPAFGLDRAVFNQGANAAYKPQIDIETTHSLTAQGPGAVAQPPRYVVRRLTPTECLSLMDLPLDLCENLGNDNPTEDEIAFWADVWETHRLINGKSTKPKSRKQLLKWIKNPYSDSAAYKMCGNGLVVAVAEFVMRGIIDHAAVHPSII